MIRVAALLLAAAPQAADAYCQPLDEPFLSCTMQGGAKRLSVCVDGRTLHYAFGAVDKSPELLLSRDVTEVDYTPWPGVGRTIWEEVSFENLGHVYLVHGWLDRIPSEETDEDPQRPTGGGVTVTRGEETLATLECDPGSVEFYWTDAVNAAMAKAGRCFDWGTHTWQQCN